MLIVSAFDLVATGVVVTAAGVLGAFPTLPSLPSIPAPAMAVLVLPAAAAWPLGRRAAGRLRALAAGMRQGGAILRTPLRYVRDVAALQAAAWCCRVGVTFFLLQAFGLPASLGDALLVIGVGAVAGLVPLAPGGAGTQQVLLGYALRDTATTTAVLSFSVGLQVGVTAVNAAVGLAAAMVIFGTLCPKTAVRTGWRLAAAERVG